MSVPPRTGDGSLRQPLPDDVAIGGNSVWNRYRRYPVFSATWLGGRTLLFGGMILAFAVLSSLGMLVGGGSLRGAVLGGGYTFAGFLVMTTAGPAFATLVRHLRLRRERLWVVVAWIAGIVAAYLGDSWASSHINTLLRGELGAGIDVEALEAARPTGPVAQALMVTVKLMTLAFIYGLLGGGMALRAYFGEQRRLEASRHRTELAALQAQKREADLRLGALQAQVEPHFLFNTLASVRALVRQDPARAEATLDALVDYLRATIPRLRDARPGSGEAAIRSTLGQQLDLCARYLELMRLRTGDRLHYRIDAEPALRALDYPPLLLITLVENAIKHGIEPKPGTGNVAIRAWREHGQLCVAVVDDGVGLQPGVGGGVGLANVREQLAARFGPRAGLRLTGNRDGGAQAEIRTPLESAA
ncbi:histidine kinase [Luteimonas sp. BDR2-5]|uniref:sensor histidine kinase n=1 Tax=Proluteimonas luteida TaxID=2878685 RepID=UPI001E46B9A9|nr:histidine kinase [Luteimonas sp. BDR2-5]MCD9028245.1 histidine kinase [Luteimonas sp. BDR2-5]